MWCNRKRHGSNRPSTRSSQQAAQAPVVDNDDTTLRILKLTAAARAEALPAGAKAERTGVFTSGVVAETIHGPIALFKTGPGHAGEHLAQILRPPPGPAAPHPDVRCPGPQHPRGPSDPGRLLHPARQAQVR